MRTSLLIALFAATALAPVAASAQDWHGRGGDRGAQGQSQGGGGHAGGWAGQAHGGGWQGAQQQARPAPSQPVQAQPSQVQPRQFDRGAGLGQPRGGWAGRGEWRGRDQAVQQQQQIQQQQQQQIQAQERFRRDQNQGFRGDRGAFNGQGRTWQGQQALQDRRGPDQRGGDWRNNGGRGGDWRNDNRNGGDWRNNGGRGGDWRNNGGRNGGNWNRNWRSDNRYNWNDRRYRDRSAFHLPRYYAPYGWGYGYRRFSIGYELSSILYAQNYWIDDAYDYGLPPAYGPYRWVRYYNDALLVDIYSGEVVDAVYDIFW